VSSGEKPGFWARADVRRFLPVAVALTAFALLLMTATLVPRERRAFKPPPAAPVSEKASVSEEAVPLRETPATRSRALRVLTRNAAVTLLEQSGVWCRVRDDSGSVGFLPSTSIERSSDRNARLRRAGTILGFTPLSGAVAAPTALRLAPFSFAPVWGEAAAGSGVEIYSVDHGFYAVKLPDGTLGFIASADVDLVPANPSEPALRPGKGKVVTGISVSEENESASASPLPGPAPPASERPVPNPGPSVADDGYSVTPALLLEKFEPAYPPGALSARMAGTVLLEITIDASGNVSGVEVKHGAPLGMTEAAVSAVRKWRYRPASGPGGPLPSVKLVRVDFRPPE
jgi:TonB family protein